AANFVLHPEDLEVVVASNLLADILSDLCSALAGSLGIAASANLNPDGRYRSMFESVHGSASDIAAQGIVNTNGAIGNVKLMLDNFELKDEAMQLNNAIKKATESGVHTQDIGGNTTTEEMTNAIIQNLNYKIVK